MTSITKSFSEVIACILIMSSLAACADSYVQNASDGTYHPKTPAGINSIDAARGDLARLLNDRGSGVLIEFDENYCAQHNLQELMRSDAGRSAITRGTAHPSRTEYSWVRDRSGMSYIDVGTPSIDVKKDMLKVSSRLFLLYSDLPGLSIKVERLHGNLFVMIGDKQMDIGTLGKDSYRVADDLYFIQQYFTRERDNRIARFKTEAGKYRSLTVEPPVPEEQRKYIAQANAMDQSKDYAEAIDLYRKAVDVNPVSSPGIYFKLALVNAQIHRYHAAIGYMKQYLLLKPNSKYARIAKDKIYAWEIMRDRSAE